VPEQNAIKNRLKSVAPKLGRVKQTLKWRAEAKGLPKAD
jgi:hypothetical protein